MRSHNPILPRLRFMWEEGWVHFISTNADSIVRGISKPLKKWSRRSGLNGRPAVYETAALPTELRRLSHETTQLTRVFSQPQGVFRPTTDDRDQQAPDCNTLACLPKHRDPGCYLNLATGCSLTMDPWPGPGRQRGSCSFPYCSRAILDTCPLV